MTFPVSYSLLAINHGRIFMQRRIWCDRPHMPRTGLSVAGLTQDVAVPGWPAASRQPRTLLAGVVAAQKACR